MSTINGSLPPRPTAGKGATRVEKERQMADAAATVLNNAATSAAEVLRIATETANKATEAANKAVSALTSTSGTQKQEGGA